MDSVARDIAILCDRSVIVQAPAGSGKTELLVQRYLALLANRANHPHEVLAITFTKKAAQEMVHRIQSALQAAKQDLPCLPHQAKTRWLAKQVLQKDTRLKWNVLLLNSQLKCLTFDGFCQQLLNKQPITLQKTPSLKVTDNPILLYEEAIDNWFRHQDPESKPLKYALLTLFDNRIFVLKQKLIGLLQKREEWLPLVHEFKSHLSQDNTPQLAAYIQDNIGQERMRLLKNMTEALQLYVSELLPLLKFAIKNQNTALEIDLDEPFANEAVLDLVLSLLLTQQDEFRKKIDKNTGFPAKDKLAPENEINKQAMMVLLDVMTLDERLKQSLIAFKYRPGIENDFVFQNTQTIILALLSLFTALQDVFMRRGEADFQDFALKAYLALGTEDEPSEVYLQTLNEVKHILVDEFQDTSQSQWQLLERLIAGWQMDELNTLFLVGDPMQSIYRFRNAKVGFFLKAREEGIAGLSLEPIYLQQNFRSSGDLVTWFNAEFLKHFGEHDNLALDIVGFSKAIATVPSEGTALIFRTDVSIPVAEWIAIELKKLLLPIVKPSIAILVRQRTHLEPILQALNQAKIPYQGVELISLYDCQWVLDWFSWLSVLCDPLDTLSWCALLRSPLVNCTHVELVALFGDLEPVFYTVINELGKSESVFDKLIHDKASLKKLMQLVQVFHETQLGFAMDSFYQCFEKSWSALGADILLPHNQAKDDIEKCMNALQNVKSLRGLALLKYMNSYIQKKRSHAEMQEEAVQVMTIHQAKGLEFDYVFLPDGEKIMEQRQQDRELLLFENVLQENNQSNFLISTAPPRREPDSVYRYLQWREKLKSQEEAKRLFYVAATRARKGLYLEARLNDVK